jgi:hypothetical protein
MIAAGFEFFFRTPAHVRFGFAKFQKFERSVTQTPLARVISINQMGACFSGPSVKESNSAESKQERDRKRQEEEKKKEDEVESALSTLQNFQKEIDYVSRLTKCTALFTEFNSI